MLTLHEEIISILKESSEPMTTIEIAEEVNRRERYLKRDRSEITPFQIHGRTRKYSMLFWREGSSVGLIEWNNKDNVRENKSSPSGTDLDTEIDLSQDPSKKEFLIRKHFICLGTIQVLFENGLPDNIDLGSCGVYVTVPDTCKVDFICPEEAKINRNVIKPSKPLQLKNKWVKNTTIVYYGLAGRKSPRSLKERLHDLIRQGKGKTSINGPHKGGEILWQLKEYDTFSVWMLRTPNPPSPREIEKGILRKFYDINNKLPFANRQI